LRRDGYGPEPFRFALWTFGHEFMDNENADKFLAVQLKAVREHTPERYEMICKSMLHWGRKLPGQEGEEIFTNLLHKIACHTLISCGLRDFWIPASFSKIIAEKIIIPYISKCHIADTLLFVKIHKRVLK
jgi:hypothetical protein